MQKPRDSFANHLPANLQAQKPHRHPWDNHHSSGSDTAAEEGDLAVMDVALRPLLSSTAYCYAKLHSTGSLLINGSIDQAHRHDCV